ncbi:bifunctional lysylphosphatidylglycerol flippase/synthetase MprF [Paenibacillus sp. WLX1005]|uniref:bifunctional lysylphosphatidylglycerol flippase/synthetase MprF n=1 Tax=Paenibacillus sp. WLX1005 TaxID=3243766 RepID=UPI0039841AFC
MRETLRKLKILQLMTALFRARIIKILIPIIILVIIIIQGRKEIEHINLGRVLFELHRMPVSAIIQISLASFIAVSAMSTYDYLLRKHFKLDVEWKAAFRYAWIANTFNNMIGFAGLTGVGLRAILYKKSGVPIKTMGSAILFLSPIILVGLSLLGWLTIIGIFPVEPMFDAHPWLRFAVWGVSLYLPFFLLMQRSSLFAKWFHKEGEGKLPWSIVIASVGASFLEWACAAVLFWLILYHDLDHLPFATAIGIYVVAAIAGIISMAPGGIGAFDLTALLGLQTIGVDSTRAITALVLFRMFYFLIPWLIGLVLAAFEITPSRRQMKDMVTNGLDSSRNAWTKFWGWPSQFGLLGDLGAWALGKLVLASGIILLLSAATPGLIERMRFMENILSLPIMRLSEQLSVVIGIMLIIVSRGISLRIRRAFVWTAGLLIAGAVFTFAKGFDYEEAIILMIVAIILWVSRAKFNRESASLSPRSIGVWVILAFISSLCYYLVGSQIHPSLLRHLPARAQQWFLNPHEYAVTAVIAFISALIVLAAIFALRPNRHVEDLPDAEQLDKLNEFLQNQQGNLLSHLLYLGDKTLYWAQEGKILIPYSRVRDKLVVLGDPIGDKSLAGAAIQEFQRYADHFALTVVFYQAAPEYLSIYHENGYNFFKLGEEALVPLDKFTLSGKSNQGLRTAKNKSEREGQLFEVLQPPFSAELISELRLISNEWLGDRKEKAYSLGWFHESYLQRAPIALLREASGRILAFATLAPAYDNNRIVSIDLMRHLNETPNGTMDVLFVRLIEWAKESGYAYFNLGMSPLSSVGENANAHREEKLARLVFQYGGHWYGFEGLRRYKEKFSPEWEARYLAYPAGMQLPFLTIDLVRLVSRKPGKMEHTI